MKKETTIAFVKDDDDRSKISNHSDIPIVMYCIGNPPHLQYTLLQALLWNPQSPCFLIGDQNQEDYPYAQCISVDRYPDAAKEAVLLSKGDSEIQSELLRWTTLRNVVRAYELQEFFFLSPSVLLFASLQQERELFNAPVTLTYGRSAQQSYWQAEYLEMFVEFIRSHRTGEHSTEWRSLIGQIKKTPLSQVLTSYSETALALFSLQHSGLFSECTRLSSGKLFDGDIQSEVEGLECVNGLKNIIWLEEKPYGIHVSSNTKVRLLSLSFNDSLLETLPKYFREQAPTSP